MSEETPVVVATASAVTHESLFQEFEAWMVKLKSYLATTTHIVDDVAPLAETVVGVVDAPAAPMLAAGVAALNAANAAANASTLAVAVSNMTQAVSAVKSLTAPPATPSK